MPFLCTVHRCTIALESFLLCTYIANTNSRLQTWRRRLVADITDNIDIYIIVYIPVYMCIDKDNEMNCHCEIARLVNSRLVLPVIV